MAKHCKRISLENFPIFLIGMMGSGKTTVGKILAKKKKFSFVDLDKEIEINYKDKISSIFNMEGENQFRKKEHEVLKLCCKKKILLFQLEAV